MNCRLIMLLAMLVIILACRQQQNSENENYMRISGNGVARVIEIDSMEVRNPFIFLDKENLTYYMIGDGGDVWTSNDMKRWQGPYNVLHRETTEGIDKSRIIAPEIHKYNNRYYLVATLRGVGNDSCKQKHYNAECNVFVADKIQGPYSRISSKRPILVTDTIAQGTTFTTDFYNVGYLIYCTQTACNSTEAINVVRLSEKCDKQIGEPYTMLSTSDAQWQGSENSSGIAWFDGPFLFSTRKGRVGMLFATEYNGKEALAVAYSKNERGHPLNGPWQIEERPLLTDGYGQASLLSAIDGTPLMVLHRKAVYNNKTRYVPHIFEIDTDEYRLKIKREYNY